MLHPNPTPNTRGFKTVPPAADNDPRLDRTAVGILTYLLGVDGDATVTLDGMQEQAREGKLKQLEGTPTLLRLIEARRESRRIARSLTMLEAAGYVRLDRRGKRVEVIEVSTGALDA